MADPHKYEPSYDLVNQYDWTSVARNSPMRNEAPAAYVTAYNLEFSQLRTFIDGYLNVLSPTHFGTINPKGAKSATPGLDFYRRLYGTSSEPITRLSFPFFSDNIRAFTTEFSDSFSPISQRGAKVLGGEFLQGLGGAAESVIGGSVALGNAVANIGNLSNEGDKSFVDKVYKTGIQTANKGFSGLLGRQVDLGKQTVGAPGSYIETPQFYQYSNTDNGLQLSFALSNTLNDDAKEKNHKFITDFTRMNRPYRTGAIGMTFPAIYNIVVPGQRYIMWASLESFNVGLLGMRRRIKTPTGGSRVVPEAYSCEFTFRSLTIEAANFMDEIDKFGSFAGDENSYASLKKAEQKALKGEKEALANAAIGREEGRSKRVDADPAADPLYGRGVRENLLRDDDGHIARITAQVDAGERPEADIARAQRLVEQENLRRARAEVDNYLADPADNPNFDASAQREAAVLNQGRDPLVMAAGRTDLTDFEINNNAMVAESRRQDENRAIAEDVARQRAEADKPTGIPEHLLPQGLD